ncbi:MAG TPA: metallophosphoesterase family protein [Chloroflexia bacterium]|nr:metallophosphoesterase family protein [Chloroflexia bacterium]
MRVAIISDIHGNCVALDAVLTDLRAGTRERVDTAVRSAESAGGGSRVDKVVCLGDAIQGGPQPAEVVARLRELACPVVMGNADAWLLTAEETGAEVISDERRRKMADVRAWSLAQLSGDDRAFIAAFQPTITVPLDERNSLLCFHGSPTSFDDVILPTTGEEQFMAWLGPFLPCIQTGGHTHMQQIRRIGASSSFFFNPGSVGLAYSHQQPEAHFRADPWAEYAILTVENGSLGLEFRRVPFDGGALVATYQASGRPHASDAIAQYGR